ncbi:MAG: helix-turn-helix transcriptional regulator, partial [Clostridia bacterium]|nr:helix-turn-helix transcriptional regulator [Clostridia bacterium]
MISEQDGYTYQWHNCRVIVTEGYQSTMADFHTHNFYEISLILTGNVKSLLADRSVDGAQSRLVLTAPHMPHWMYLTAPGLYSRVNLSFSHEFVADYVPEWRSLLKVFGTSGNILMLTDEQKELCRARLLALREETDPFRQRLCILWLLSYIAEIDRQEEDISLESPPPYIVEALRYIDTHYSERIVARELAWRTGVGRTTLMTAFRAYTGTTLTEYVTRVRVKAAIRLLRQGESQERIAEQVGLGNG